MSACVLHKPLYVAEVLTMRQVLVLGIHAVANLETARIVNGERCMERELVSIPSCDGKWVNVVDMVHSVLVRGESYQFQPYGIVQACLVYDNLDVVLLAGFVVAVGYFFRLVDAYYVDCVPTLGYGLLPKGYFLCQLVAIG